MSRKKYDISRRKFMERAAITAMGLSTLPSALFKFNALNAAAIDNSMVFGNEDYKALVCFFHSGGNDSFNMLIPKGGSEYQEYASTRSNLAIADNSTLGLNILGGDGRNFGLHPSMTEVRDLFNDGKLSFISNVGALVQPTTKQTYRDESAVRPLGLYSHSDQQKHWQSGRAHERSNTGWGGRLADLMQAQNSNANISMNISLSGQNIFQYGDDTIEFSIGENGASTITRYQNYSSTFDTRVSRLIDSAVFHNYNDMYQQSYVDVIKNSILATNEFEAAIDAMPTLQTSFTNNSISNRFRMIAKTIQASESLGFKRQIFFVNYGGWDHHDGLLDKQEDKLEIVSQAMSEFASAMEEIQMFDKVTTFSVSEFGRTLTSNGDGSDHAWGGNVMVMGGDVNGQRIYGDYPSLDVEGPLSVSSRGVLIPTTSTDEYFAELALWFGVSPSELLTIFPNLGNFYAPLSGVNPIGFMNF